MRGIVHLCFELLSPPQTRAGTCVPWARAWGKPVCYKMITARFGVSVIGLQQENEI